MVGIRNRKTLVQSYYLDLPKLHRYWNGDHTYHHTACSNVVYTMHEALRIVLEEGLETRWARHRLNGVETATDPLDEPPVTEATDDLPCGSRGRARVKTLPNLSN